jgi:hypothetical protein
MVPHNNPPLNRLLIIIATIIGFRLLPKLPIEIFKLKMRCTDSCRVWVDKDRKERRTSHDNGDDTFVVDGETINHRSLIEKWVLEGV